MIQLRRITQVNDPDLSRLMDLYILSFPEEERRDEKQLFRMIETVPEMSFNAVEENGELCGLSVFWDLGEFYYMEHLAVFPEMRNRKIGQQILDYWKNHLPKLQILEGTAVGKYVSGEKNKVGQNLRSRIFPDLSQRETDTGEGAENQSFQKRTERTKC